MIFPAGPRKYLLLNPDAALRNNERSPGKCEPTAVLFIEQPNGTYCQHLARTVSVDGVVTLAYSQHKFLIPGWSGIRSAYTTTYEVVVDAEYPVEEPIPTKGSTAITKPKPAAKTATQIKTKESDSNG